MTDKIEDDLIEDKDAKLQVEDEEISSEAVEGSVESVDEACKKDKEDEEEDEEDMEKDESYKKGVKESFEEDLTALVSSEEGLSEEFKEKASVIFEAAVIEKISAKIEEIEEGYDKKLETEIERLSESFNEKLDGYLDYSVSNWMNENSVALENNFKNEIAESFMNSLKTVFTEHYVDVPESKRDLFDQLSEKVEKMEENYNSEVDSAIALRKELNDLKKKMTIAESLEGLTAIQQEKLEGLAESVEFEDVDSFRGKLEILKTSYFNESTKTEPSSINELNEETVEEDSATLTPEMAAYLKALA
jgi:isocitrate dehydrogenase kinase/phosphatase